MNRRLFSFGLGASFIAPFIGFQKGTAGTTTENPALSPLPPITHSNMSNGFLTDFGREWTDAEGNIFKVIELAHTRDSTDYFVGVYPEAGLRRYREAREISEKTGIHIHVSEDMLDLSERPLYVRYEVTGQELMVHGPEKMLERIDRQFDEFIDNYYNVRHNEFDQVSMRTLTVF